MWRKPASSEPVAPAQRVFTPINGLSSYLYAYPQEPSNSNYTHGSSQWGTALHSSQEREFKGWNPDVEVLYRSVVLVSSKSFLVPAHFLVSSNCLFSSFPGPQKRPFTYKHLKGDQTIYIEVCEEPSWQLTVTRNSYACSGLSFYLQLCSPWDIRERSHCLLWKFSLLSPVPLVTATLSSPPYQQLLPFPSPIRPVVFGIQPPWLLLPLDLPWGDTISPRDLSCCCLYHSCSRIIESTVITSATISSVVISLATIFSATVSSAPAFCWPVVSLYCHLHGLHSLLPVFPPNNRITSMSLFQEEN